MSSSNKFLNKPTTLNKSHSFISSSRTIVVFITVLSSLTSLVTSDINNKIYNDQDYPSSDPYTIGDLRPSLPTKFGGCSSCKIREEVKLRNKALMKEEILKKMGFDAPPNITGKVLPQVPAHYLEKFDQALNDEAYGEQFVEEEDDFHVQTKNILTFAQPYPRLRHSGKGHDILHFPFTESITKFHVVNATLNIFIRGVERRPQLDVVLEIYKLMKPGGTDHNSGMTRVYSGKVKQPLGKGSFVEVDFAETVGEWFKNPRNNFGFIIDATVNGRKVAVTDVDTEKAKSPYVEIATVEPKRRRRRNSEGICDEKSNTPTCCRYKFEIDFIEIGLDFIIAPRKYDAYMCSGECEYMAQQNYFHTHILQMSAPNSAGPCCVPRKLSSISMLYFDQKLNIVYGNLPGMVVEKCGCT